MIICYHRSSSLGTLEFCEQQYFLEYNLGWRNKTNKKAVMGTIVHRALQVLGDKSVAVREGKKIVENDDIQNLTLDECDDLELITKLAFDYYSKHEGDVGLTNKELRTCTNWLYKAVSYNDGELDPRNQDIHSTELFFDIEIDKPWAAYKYDIGGRTIEGNLSIKGTIDVIANEGENYYQILDYKTGQRKNWATGEEKTYEKLQKDTQLLLYYYALKNMMPDAEFYVSIFYINAGGLYSMVFDDDDYALAESILRQKFEYIFTCTEPKALSYNHKDWKCQRLCKFSQPSEQDPSKSMCQFIHDDVRERGMKAVIEDYGDLDKVSQYGDGGGRLASERKDEDEVVSG